MSPSSNTPDRSFFTTRWSLVLAIARDDDAGRRALEELCSLYWPPVYAFYRRSGHDLESAKDLTQGLFLHLLEREDLTKADPERGRFRTWLRTCARHFAANHHRSEKAARRGGGAARVALDLFDADSVSGLEPTDRDTPDLAFERQFARTLLGAVLDQLADEFTTRGRGALFGTLRCYLEVDGGPGFAASAAALGMTEGAVRVSVHRMRKRFRELLVAEVRQTVADEGEVSDEIEALLGALRRPETDSPGKRVT